MISAIDVRLQEVLWEGENTPTLENHHERSLEELEGILNAHGRLGETAKSMSGREQAGLLGAEKELARLNAEYERVFGGLKFVSVLTLEAYHGVKR